MTGQRTTGSLRLTERQKARARLVLLTLIAVIAPPLAGVRSPAVWAVYISLVVAYSLWTLRLTRNYSGDRRLGYLLCLADGAVLLPLLVWSSAPAARVLLVLALVAGGLATQASGGMSKLGKSRHRLESGTSRFGAVASRQTPDAPGACLEGALRVRLRIFSSANTRFALVILRIVRFEETASYYGPDAAERLVTAVSRRGLRLLGPDAQLFVLEGGRVAFVFATETYGRTALASEDGGPGWIDPYDVETVAMNMARRACEHLVDGHRVECVVGWASAPADGLSAEDLVYTAESGAQSTAAFRRVAGARVPVPERSRVAAG